MSTRYYCTSARDGVLRVRESWNNSFEYSTHYTTAHRCALELACACAHTVFSPISPSRSRHSSSATYLRPHFRLLPSHRSEAPPPPNKHTHTHTHTYTHLLSPVLGPAFSSPRLIERQRDKSSPPFGHSTVKSSCLSTDHSHDRHWRFQPCTQQGPIRKHLSPCQNLHFSFSLSLSLFVGGRGGVQPKLSLLMFSKSAVLKAKHRRPASAIMGLTTTYPLAYAGRFTGEACQRCRLPDFLLVKTRQQGNIAPKLCVWTLCQVCGCHVQRGC